jgi:hypothetical protein
LDRRAQVVAQEALALEMGERYEKEQSNDE